MTTHVHTRNIHVFLTHTCTNKVELGRCESFEAKEDTSMYRQNTWLADETVQWNNDTQTYTKCHIFTHTRALSVTALACYVWGCGMINHTLYRWPHWGEKGRRGKLSSLSAQHPSSIFSFLSLPSLPIGLRWPPLLRLSLVFEIYEWLLETHWLGKAPTRPELMASRPSIPTVCHEINKQTCAQKQSRSLWTDLNITAYTSITRSN